MQDLSQQAPHLSECMSINCTVIHITKDYYYVDTSVQLGQQKKLQSDIGQKLVIHSTANHRFSHVK